MNTVNLDVLFSHAFLGAACLIPVQTNRLYEGLIHTVKTNPVFNVGTHFKLLQK